MNRAMIFATLPPCGLMSAIKNSSSGVAQCGHCSIEREETSPHAGHRKSMPLSSSSESVIAHANVCHVRYAGKGEARTRPHGCGIVAKRCDLSRLRIDSQD